MNTAISDHFKEQAGWGDALGSPLTAQLLHRMRDNYLSGGLITELVSDWPTNPVRDALGLRLTGCLHYAVLTGRSPDLATLYPKDETDWSIDDIWPAALAYLKADEAFTREFIKSPPQTNETRRGFMFLYGLLELSKATQKPIHILELGASAGLNQNFDAFRYITNAWRWGDPMSPVEVTTDWQALTPPLATPLKIIGREACDQHPLDLSDDDTRARLKSYIWPDQRDRLDRFDAAVDLTLARGTSVEEADAADWLERKLAEARSDTLTVVMHSVFYQYPPAETRQRISDLIEEAGARATKDAPLAWLRYEPETLWGYTKSSRMALDYRLWPNDTHVRLARSDGHVRLVLPA